MHAWSCLLILLATAFAQRHASDDSDLTSPIDFLWPPGRMGGAGLETNGPCGSTGEIGSRTEFPMSNGKIALITQNEAWNVEIGMSPLNDPISNNDFEPIMTPILDLSSGHTCYPIPDPPADVVEGSNATIQIKSAADFNTEKNEIYYACVYIVYVPTSRFKHHVPCFNVSASEADVPGDGGPDIGQDGSHGDNSRSADGGSVVYPVPPNVVLSGGTIAGIVVGVLAFVAASAGLLLLWSRHKERLMHQRQLAHIGGVSWAVNQVRASPQPIRQEVVVAVEDMKK